jgi:hypothetical protein
MYIDERVQPRRAGAAGQGDAVRDAEKLGDSVEDEVD